jgi:hypothetical protein
MIMVKKWVSMAHRYINLFATLIKLRPQFTKIHTYVNTLIAFGHLLDEHGEREVAPFQI